MSKIVLTVDNSRTVRDMLSLALSDAGFRVVQADDGVHGLEVLETARPMSLSPTSTCRGWMASASSRACAATPDRAVPILVLTTENDATKKNKARRAGATGWIVKPFDPVKLIDAIRRVAA